MEKDAVKKMYNLRRKLVVIGLTGRTGSGCSTVAQLLSNKNFEDCKFVKPDRTNRLSNDERKDVIVYDFLKENWTQFKVISVSNIITSFLVENELQAVKDYISSEFQIEKSPVNVDSDFQELETIYNSVNQKSTQDGFSLELFNDKELDELTKRIKTITSQYRSSKKETIYQAFGTNLRSSGNAILRNSDSLHTFHIAERINKIITAIIENNGNEKTAIVIDSIRNSLESTYFKEQYVSFYLIAINSEDTYRKQRLNSKLNLDQIDEIDKIEYISDKDGVEKFVSQDIKGCIQNAEIYIHNPTDNLPAECHTTLKKQLVRYLSLIFNPGIITPSPVERCMQIAYTAKYNSGCISRQVGAVISNSSYSIKAVGWNNTSEGQVPCLLRNIEDLDNYDKLAYSNYELGNVFTTRVNQLYPERDFSALKGKKLCICFKDIKNDLDKKRNQVHTRSLHAEENAFLQITKYGGGGIDGGYLFTTSSPCELCSKKAYQLNIKRIYYIEPYPGIAGDHILNSGSEDKRPHLKLFHGAIGWAYHQLYQPFVPYKDELSLIYPQRTIE